MSRIAVIFLARMAEGIAPLRSFLASYSAHPAGIAHDLVVLYKGYDDPVSFAAAKEVFAAVPHVSLEVPDVGFDIGAYLSAAARLEHDYVCCLNTFTEIASKNWLASLHDVAASPGVGIAGAMGSYESLYDSMGVIQKTAWLCNEAHIPYDKRIAHYYDFIVNPLCKTWKAKGETNFPWWSPPDPLIKLVYRWGRSLPRRLRVQLSLLGVSLDEQFQRHWNFLVSATGPLAEYGTFPPFPNPHIRSNGFMVSRQRLLDMKFKPIETKLDACAFESGVDSLTSRLKRQGLRAVVVNSAGQGFDVADWVHSGTFRAAGEEKLLLTDNQSRQFHVMSEGARAAHLRMTWGDYLRAPPADFPDLGFKFAMAPQVGRSSQKESA